MNTPRVTVLLAVFNGGGLLLESLESVLAQTWRDFELLVVDDGSTDGTRDLLQNIRDPRLRVLTNPANLGLTLSLNRGLEAARGELVARHDADDRCAPTRLGEQVAFLEAHPAIMLLGSSAWRLTPDGRRCGANDLPTTHLGTRWASIVDNPFLHPTVMFRREPVLREFHGYDAGYSVCQDFDLWSRVAERYKVANLPERLVQMREHPDSMTRTSAQKTTEEAQKIMARNRALLFPQRPLKADEHALLDLFRLRFPASRLPALETLLSKLYGDFAQQFPEARTSRDLRRTRCRQHLRLGYKFLRESPRHALREILRAGQLAPAECFRQAAAMVAR